VADGRSQEAVDLDRRARRHCLDILGPDHHDTITVTANLALSLYATHHPDEADQLANEAADSARNTLGEDHPITRAIRSRKRLDSDIEPPTTSSVNP
jgi:hypothetical protein